MLCMLACDALWSEPVPGGEAGAAPLPGGPARLHGADREGGPRAERGDGDPDHQRTRSLIDHLFVACGEFTLSSEESKTELVDAAIKSSSMDLWRFIPGKACSAFCDK